ncbi:hypothetical protein KSF_109690 [Reticulibacter mediterranei]|uniref:Uncharacterized protein n=1 Tax=Reticulibacter mediterranei TaxID=2778369 RepID=A0A8J3J3K5_9CHLR|nr:hypothetical protein [Reticulibacter mediterranei]GHP00922.1 hypothetical protein KSF_109690 [Reticulibacter mediterranei]
MKLRRSPNSIAIIDFDGPVSDTSARAQEAHRRVQMKTLALEEPPAPDSNEYKALFYSTDAFYDPSLLVLDQLQPGTDIAITRLQELYTDVYILTSRPDFLAEPTEQWLSAHSLRFPRESIRYKLYAQGEDQREQRVSTAVWKAIIVHQAAVWYDHILFIDDDVKNRAEVAAHQLSNVEIKESLADYIFDDSPIIL